MKLSLSPSSATRWLDCTASPGYIAKNGFKSKSTVYNRAGTEDHSACENLLNSHYNDSAILDPRVKIKDIKRLQSINSYVERIIDTFKGCTPPFIELKIPNFYGVGNSIVDCAGVKGDTLVVRDFKSGWGLVPVEYNPQLMIYALNVWNYYDSIIGAEQITYIDMGIIQPPRKYYGSAKMPMKDMTCFKDKVLETKENIVQGKNLKFSPSKENCKWCPASGRCQAQKQGAVIYG